MVSLITLPVWKSHSIIWRKCWYLILLHQYGRLSCVLLSAKRPIQDVELEGCKLEKILDEKWPVPGVLKHPIFFLSFFKEERLIFLKLARSLLLLFSIQIQCLVQHVRDCWNASFVSTSVFVDLGKFKLCGFLLPEFPNQRAAGKY